MVMKLFKLYFYSFFLFLLIFLFLDSLNAQESSTVPDVSVCKRLEEENARLKLELENLKLEKIEVSFTNCRSICRRLQ